MTVTPAPTTIGAAVSAFAATTRFDEMPAAVQGFGRLLFVDTLGALLGACATHRSVAWLGPSGARSRPERPRRSPVS